MLRLLTGRFWVTKKSYTAQPISIFRDKSNKAILVRLGGFIYRCEDGPQGIILRDIVARKPRLTDYRPGAPIELHRCWTNSELDFVIEGAGAGSSPVLAHRQTGSPLVLNCKQTRRIAGRISWISGLATFSMPGHDTLPTAKAVERTINISWVPGGLAKK